MTGKVVRLIRLPLATAALVLTVFSLSAAPASAHWDYEEQGEDVAITSPDHMSGSVCDVERDGNYVVADWYDSAGSLVGSAEDGGDTQCSDVSQFVAKADIVKICESGNVNDPPKCSTGNV